MIPWPQVTSRNNNSFKTEVSQRTGEAGALCTPIQQTDLRTFLEFPKKTQYIFGTPGIYILERAILVIQKIAKNKVMPKSIFKFPRAF